MSLNCKELTISSDNSSYSSLSDKSAISRDSNKMFAEERF